MKAKIAIVGSGNIGWALKQLLKSDYDLRQGDIADGFDAKDIKQVKDFLKGADANDDTGDYENYDFSLRFNFAFPWAYCNPKNSNAILGRVIETGLLRSASCCILARNF